MALSEFMYIGINRGSTSLIAHLKSHYITSGLNFCYLWFSKYLTAVKWVFTVYYMERLSWGKSELSDWFLVGRYTLQTAHAERFQGNSPKKSIFYFLNSSSHLWFSSIHSYWFITSLLTDQHDYQPPVSLLAQLVEYCTGVAEVMGSNPVQTWIFFRLYFHYCL